MKQFAPLKSSRLMAISRTALASVLLLALSSTYANAREWLNDTQFHGFLTQGFTQSSGNKFFGDSDDGSFDFTEIGFNGSTQLTNRLRASGQILFRRAGEMYDGSPTLDYALLDYTLQSDESHRIGLLGGRFKNPLGFYNDTRDVAFTRPSIFLPQTVYFDRVRNFMLANDGLQAYAEFFGERDTLNIQLGAGRSPIDDNVKYAYLGANPITGQELGGNLESDGLTVVGRVLYEGDGGRWRLAFSGAKGKAQYKDSGTVFPFPGLYPDNGNTAIEYYVVSAQYNTENWSLTGEYAWEPIEWNNFSPVLPFKSTKATAEGYYLQGDYRFNDKWQSFLRYEAGFADKNDRDGIEASLATGGAVPPFNYYTKDWVVGLRWDPAPNWMVRTEFHHVDGTFTLSSKENTNPGNLEKRWNMFALLLSYRF